MLNRLRRLFAGSRRPASADLWIYVRCRRCGEVLKTRIDLYNHLSVEYGEKDSANTYVCRKLLIGDGARRCFQNIDVTLRFDAARKLIDRQISGGDFIEETDYLAALNA